MFMKKHVEIAHPHHYLVWLGFSSIGFIVVWYWAYMLGSVVLMMLSDAVVDEHYRLYTFLLSFGGLIIVYLASAFTLPLVLWVLRKLRIKDPIQGSTGVVMGIAFAAVTFFTLTDYLYRGNQGVIIIISLISVGVAAVLYGGVLRQVKHMVSMVWFIVICTVLPLVVFGADFVYRMTSLN